MRDEHIKRLLEEAPLSSLGEGELGRVREHAEGCAECSTAFEAARVSSLLMKARGAETMEPSPFFQTRVLAALRERREAEEGWTLARLWKSAGLLFSSMAATVAALLVLTFAAPQQDVNAQQLASSTDPYAVESVILDGPDAPDEQMTYGQVFTTLYDSDEEASR
jgi:hypothetical protein